MGGMETKTKLLLAGLVGMLVLGAVLIPKAAAAFQAFAQSSYMVQS